MRGHRFATAYSVKRWPHDICGSLLRAGRRPVRIRCAAGARRPVGGNDRRNARPDPGRRARQLQRSDPSAAIPVPLLEASYRFSNFEVLGYGLPPTVAIPYTNAVQGSVALRLSIFDGTFRVWDPAGHFAIGAGETIYNQTTHYATADVFATSGGERQYSRIAGAHYEIAFRVPFRAGSLETSLRYAPYCSVRKSRPMKTARRHASIPNADSKSTATSATCITWAGTWMPCWACGT